MTAHWRPRCARGGAFSAALAAGTAAPSGFLISFPGQTPAKAGMQFCAGYLPSQVSPERSGWWLGGVEESGPSITGEAEKQIADLRPERRIFRLLLTGPVEGAASYAGGEIEAGRLK